MDSLLLFDNIRDIVKDDLLKFFKDFHDMGKFVKSLNSIFLILIPIFKGVKDLKDFRPRSLVEFFLAKVLANKLERVMKKLVNKAQNTFVKGKVDRS